MSTATATRKGATTTKAGPRRGGRKSNDWTVVQFKDIETYIEEHGLSKLGFARALGVTNSTLHNWKNGRCAPDEAMQMTVKNMLEAAPPEGAAKAKAKGGARAARAPRGAGSQTLSQLREAGPAPAKPEKAPKAAKAPKPPKPPKTPKKLGRPPKAAAPVVTTATTPESKVHGNGHTNGHTNGNGKAPKNGNGHADQNAVATIVSGFMATNRVKGLESLTETIAVVKAALN